MKVFSLVLAALLLPAVVLANECQQEQAEYCQNVQAGQGQMLRCLSEHEAELGAKCRQELKAFRTKTKAANPCFEDLAEYCSELPPGRDRLTMCLLKNETRLSETCRKDLGAKKDKFFATEPCAQDLMDKCYGDLAKEEGLAVRCLIKHKGKLQARCETAMNSKIQRMRAKIPCFDDTEKFCPGTVNRGEIDACLEKKFTTLSKNCQGYIRREQGITKKDPCYPHIKTFCLPGLSHPQQMDCLDQHENDLGNACRQFRQAKKEKNLKLQEACEGDRTKLCAKEPNKGGKILICLRKNRAKVSKACAALL